MESKKLIIYGVLVGIAALFFVSLGTYFFVFTNNHKKQAVTYYSQGMEYYEKGDFQNAYYNFNKILPVSDIYINALYRQAKSADALEDRMTAISKYSLLDKLVKDDNFSPYVLWRLGCIYNLYDDTKRSRKYFLKLKNNYPASEYGIAANYMLSKTEKKPTLKKHYLLEYIKYSPTGKYSIDVAKVMLSDKNVVLSAEEKTILAECLYQNGEYRRSVAVLKEVPINYSWVYLLKSLDKLSSSRNVLKVAHRGFSLNNSHFDEDTLSEAVSTYLKYSPEGKRGAANTVYNLASDSRIKAIALYYGINSFDANSTRKKITLYENYPDSKYTPYALYDLFIQAITADKTPLALKYSKAYLQGYGNRDLTPSVLYYTAILKKKTADSSYKNDLNRLMSEFPNSYYAFLAYSNLISKNFANKRNAKITKKTDIEFPYKDNKKAAKIFVNFADLGDLSAFEDFRINDVVFKSWLEYRKGNRALSSVLARDYIKAQEVLPDRSSTVWKLAYPVYYSKEINHYASRRHLNPYLILSLIKEESHFNPAIKSPAGAMGLMQIMPSTAAEMGYSSSELLKEDVNIKLGTKYFELLIEIFSNNEPLCILSYNSGPNAVKKWVKDHNGYDFDVMVENIPYGETKTYIKKVYTAYWNYLLTYEGLRIPNAQ